MVPVLAFSITVLTGVFASNMLGSRKSGVSAHIDLPIGQQKIVAEFTFCGTVLSWGELSDERLTPIQQWVQYLFDYTGTVDLQLCVNPIASSYPIDFRNESDMLKDRTMTDNNTKIPSESDSRDMIREANARASGEDGNWIFSGHPSTVKEVKDQN